MKTLQKPTKEAIMSRIMKMDLGDNAGTTFDDICGMEDYNEIENALEGNTAKEVIESINNLSASNYIYSDLPEHSWKDLESDIDFILNLQQ